MKGLVTLPLFGPASALLLASICSCSPAPQVQVPPEPVARKPYDFHSEGRFPPPPVVAAEPASAELGSAISSAPKTATSSGSIPPITESGGASQEEASSARGLLEPNQPVVALEESLVFRVQIFAGESQALAEQIRSEAEENLETRAYIEYIEPYFKVRVGDCRTREECLQLERRLELAGYESPWTVRTSIKP